MRITIRNISEEDIPQVVDIQVEGWRIAYKGIIDDEFLTSMDKEKQRERRRNKRFFRNIQYSDKVY